MKLKIFSDRRFLPSGVSPTPLLYPFWQEFYTQKLESWISPYENYVKVGSSIFEMSPSLEDSDLAILPFDWRSIRGDSWRHPIRKDLQEMAIKFAQLVQTANKPLIVFFGSECSDEKIPIQSLLTFRQSVYRSVKLPGNNPVFPFFCEDFVEHFCDNVLPIREKSNVPVVGFCGFARPVSLKRKLQSYVYHAMMLATQGKVGISPYKGEDLRIKALNTLEQHPQIQSNFVIRKNAIFFEAPNELQKRKARIEYVQNITESDYILCCRGSGNYSNRLYEVLSCGRIPIFIDTDCHLPWEPFINWKNYCIWINEKDLPNLAERVIEFHESLSPQEFVDLQYSCRRLWKDWLSAEGFYTKLELILPAKKHADLI